MTWAEERRRFQSAEDEVLAVLANQSPRRESEIFDALERKYPRFVIRYAMSDLVNRRKVELTGRGNLQQGGEPDRG